MSVFEQRLAEAAQAGGMSPDQLLAYITQNKPGLLERLADTTDYSFLYSGGAGGGASPAGSSGGQRVQTIYGLTPELIPLGNELYRDPVTGQQIRIGGEGNRVMQVTDPDGNSQNFDPKTAGAHWAGFMPGWNQKEHEFVETAGKGSKFGWDLVKFAATAAGGYAGVNALGNALAPTLAANGLAATEAGMAATYGGGSLEAALGAEGLGVPEPAWESTVDPSFVRSVTEAAPAVAGVPEPAWESTVDPGLVNEKMFGPVPGSSSLLDTVKKLATSGGGAAAAAARILGGNGSMEDWLSVAGAAAPGLIGAYASNQQADALREIAADERARFDEFRSYGAPYRERLAATYADPEAWLKSPEVQAPVQQATNTLMRSLSTQGNPFGSGNAWQEGENFAATQLFGKLGQERDRLAGFGGLTAYNNAGATGSSSGAETRAVAADTNVWNAAGAATGDIFNPRRSIEDVLRGFRP